MYKIEYSKKIMKDLEKLDKYTRTKIINWIDKNLIDKKNPREKGRALTGNLSGRWRYRIGDYRLICQIKDEELIILALTVGHRKEIYS